MLRAFFFHFWHFHYFFHFWGGKRSEHFWRKTEKENGVENGKTTVYGSPGRGGPHLSGDVTSPNVSKSMGFGKVFMREDRAWQIEEFRGPQRGPRVPGAPGGKRKKNGVENGKKTVRPGCPRGGKRKTNGNVKNGKKTFWAFLTRTKYIYIYIYIYINGDNQF